MTLNEIVGVLEIINLASSRGAFRGPELAAVGDIYSKLEQFVKDQQPQSTEEAQLDVSSSEEEEEVETVSGELLS